MLPLEAAGLPPRITNRSVRSRSGMGIRHMFPYIRWEVTFLGSWSTLDDETLTPKLAWPTSSIM